MTNEQRLELLQEIYAIMVVPFNKSRETFYYDLFETDFTKEAEEHGFELVCVFDDRCGSDYDCWEEVYKLTYKGQTIYFNWIGSYSSWDGRDMTYADDLQFVEPTVVQTIEYRNV